MAPGRDVKEVNHAMEEAPANAIDFTGVLECANERFQLLQST